jgi:Na+/H+-dicarboxylate symporter
MDKSMKSNVMGMLWTAGAVVVGIVVANMINTKLLAKKSAVATTDADEGEE